MRVAVCNVSQVPNTVVERAKVEAVYVFQVMDVEIRWMDCGVEISAPDLRPQPDFIVRFQAGGHFRKADPVSLDAMGRAFMDSNGYGYMVDAYYTAIRDLAMLFPFVGDDQLMGYVMAHELGHLLIGAGHRPNGIMRPTWNKAEIEALKRRHLKFTDLERTSILRALAARAASGAATH
jgi:hypothetical protein